MTHDFPLKNDSNSDKSALTANISANTIHIANSSSDDADDAVPSPSGSLETPVFIPTYPKGSKEYFAELAASIMQDLFNNKAEKANIFDAEGQNKGNFFNIIAQGNSNRHTSALASKLLYRLKHFYRLKSLVSGMEEGNWVLLDLGGLVVHIFTPEAYEYYDLVDFWNNFENYKMV